MFPSFPDKLHDAALKRAKKDQAELSSQLHKIFRHVISYFGLPTLKDMEK
jgi:hypothetical protein